MSLGAQRTVTSRIVERLKGRARDRVVHFRFFCPYTHAILLIVSGSFVLETSSSCGLVVPMRALPRPMGRHRVPLIFAVDVVVVVVAYTKKGGEVRDTKSGEEAVKSEEERDR